MAYAAGDAYMAQAIRNEWTRGAAATIGARIEMAIATAATAVLTVATAIAPVAGAVATKIHK